MLSFYPPRNPTQLVVYRFTMRRYPCIKEMSDASADLTTYLHGECAVTQECFSIFIFILYIRTETSSQQKQISLTFIVKFGIYVFIVLFKYSRKSVHYTKWITTSTLLVKYILYILNSYYSKNDYNVY